jgi:glyoxylate carboligase
MCPAQYQPCYACFPNATRIKSQQIILLIKEVDHILFIKRGGLFNAFPNLGRKVIKSATKEKICFLICQVK